MALTVEQILAQYGPQYRKGILNPGDLIKPLYDRTEWDDNFTLIETENTVIDKAAWTMSKARLQKYQKAYLPLGGMEFTPNIIPLTHVMQDTEVTPAEIEGTALDFLAAQKLTAYSAPILNLFLQSYVAESNDSFHRNETYKGIDVPITTGVSSPVSGLFNGIREQFRLAKITGAGIPKPTTLLAGNTVPTDPKLYVEYVHALFDSINPKYKDSVKFIAVDQDLILRYKEGLRLAYQTYYNQLGQNPQFDTSKRVKLFSRDCELRGSYDMQGTDHHWCTVQGNAIRGVKKGSNMMAWNADQMIGGRTIWASNDYWTGYGFQYWLFSFDNGK